LNEKQTEIQTLINSLLILEKKLINEQTEIQRLVFSLFTIFNQQRKVASSLSKSPSTISSHFKKGSGEEFLMIYHNLIRVMQSLQVKAFPDYKLNHESLQNSIRTHLQLQINELYPKE
jgi:CII-binding regulator of phage lambda lysogenization HflD